MLPLDSSIFTAAKCASREQQLGLKQTKAQERERLKEEKKAKKAEDERAKQVKKEEREAKKLEKENAKKNKDAATKAVRSAKVDAMVDAKNAKAAKVGLGTDDDIVKAATQKVLQELTLQEENLASMKRKPTKRQLDLEGEDEAATLHNLWEPVPAKNASSTAHSSPLCFDLLQYYYVFC